MNEAAGFEGLEAADDFSGEGLAFAEHVHHLTAAHAARARGMGQSEDEFRPGLGVGMGVGFGEEFEGAGLQRIAGQDGGGFVELAMGGGLTAAQVVIVHGGKVVMHQGIGMQHLDRGGDAGGAVAVNAEQAGRLHDEEGAHAFAPPESGVAHGFEQPGLEPVGDGEKEVDGVFDLGGAALESVGQGFAHSADLTDKAPSARATMACTRCSASASLASQWDLRRAPRS